MEGHIKWGTTGAVLASVFSLTDDETEIIRMIKTQKGLQEYFLQVSPWMQNSLDKLEASVLSGGSAG